MHAIIWQKQSYSIHAKGQAEDVVLSDSDSDSMNIVFICTFLEATDFISLPFTGLTQPQNGDVIRPAAGYDEMVVGK